MRNPRRRAGHRGQGRSEVAHQFGALGAALVLASLATAPAEARAAGVDGAVPAPAATPTRGAADPSHTVRFEPNRGQTNGAARFIVRGGGGPAFLTATDAVFVLTKPGKPRATAASPSPGDIAGTVVRMHVRDGNPNAEITTESRLPGATNYLLGNDPSKWVTGVPSYAAVRYHGVYPGIDILYHTGRGGDFEYDFLVAPGASTDTIDLEFQGADNVSASAGGGLSVGTPAGEIHQRPPGIYQDVAGRHQMVTGGYTLKPDHRVGFSVGAHDATRPLVIDPLLTYSTYLGGSSGFGNEGAAIVADSSGSAYVTGHVNSVVDFPTTSGAFQGGFGGTTATATNNAYVTKLSADGASLVYSTYLGGTGGCYFCGDQGYGIAIDSSGDAFVTGDTTSTNFPVTAGAFQSSLQGPGGGDRNAFVSELNPQGTGLVYSTYLGGSGDVNSVGERGSGIVVDSSGAAIITGTTNSPVFPVTADAYQATCRSNCPTNADGVSQNGSFTYTSATAGFNTFDIGAPISGANLAPNTKIASVQSPTSLTLDTAATGGGTGLTFTIPAGAREHSAGFVAKVDPTKAGAASLKYSTLLGGGLGSNASAISLDGPGAVHITGSTTAADFPVTPGVYESTCGACPSYSDGTIDADLTTLHSATARFTPDDAIQSEDIMGNRLSTSTHIATVVDATTITLDRSALSAGTTTFTIPYRRIRGESYVAKLDPSLGKSALVYATFFGHGPSYTNGIAVDSAGASYVTGDTSSATMPTTAGAFDRLCHQTTNSPCGVHPTFTDGVSTAGSRSFTSASAHFDPVTDRGGAISGANIPANTTVSWVASPTMAVLSQAATATGSGLTFSLTRNNNAEGFVAKLNAGATSLSYSSYLGGTSGGSNRGIAVDASGRAFVTGNTFAGSTYPLRDPVAAYGGGTDATVTELTADGSGLVFSTFLGGSAGENGNAVFVDAAGVAYVTGGTSSSNFPITAGVVQPTYGGSQLPSLGNAFIARIAPVAASAPIVSGISPRHGPLTGGTADVVTGHGFTNAGSVKFGGVAATGFRVDSDTQITATIPPRAPPPPGTQAVAGVTVTTGGGTSPDNPVDRYSYGEGQWTATGSMSLPRNAASATLLKSGKVLVAGGADPSAASVATAELYDPSTGTWNPTGSLNVPRLNHTATLLSDGRVLVVGGYTGSAPMSSVEVYDPAAIGCGITGCWTSVTPLPALRLAHTATLLSDGRVLVAGGQPGGNGTQVATALVYDPAANTWTAVGSMSTGRSTATATLLPNGKVLVAGGCCTNHNATAGADLFDPTDTSCGAPGCWKPTGALHEARLGHTATLLPSGKVLVAAGAAFGSSTALRSIELYDTPSGTWSLVGLTQRPRVGHTATLLPDGRVLLTGGLGGIFSSPGGLQTAEIVDPASPSSTISADLMLEGRGQELGNDDGPGGPSFPAILLASGRVLETGGSDDATAELYVPAGAPAPAVAALPAMSNGAYGGIVTAATIENIGPDPASVHIAYFDQNGVAVGIGDVISSLPPQASWTVRQDNGQSFPGSGGDLAQAGSAIVFSTQPIASFVNEFPPGNVGDATSYTGVPLLPGAGPTLYAPTIVNRAFGGYTTGIGLVNRGSSTTDVTVTYRDGGGTARRVQTVSGLAANASQALYSGDAGLALPDGFVGTATITGSAGALLAAVVNETGPGGQLSSYDAVAAGSLVLNAPVALNNAFNGYYTGMGIQNTSATMGTVSVTYYNASGASTAKSFPIAANGTLAVYQGSATDGPAPGAYTAVIQSATVPMAAIVNEVAPVGAGSARQSTSYNTVGGGGAGLHLPLVENAGTDHWSTGEGIMNTGSISTTVTVSYRDAVTGAAIGTPQTQLLAPRAIWALYQPTGGLPTGSRATALITASSGGQVAVICNESSAGTFMSYSAQ